MGRGLSNSAIVDVYRRYGHLMQRRTRMLLRHESMADEVQQAAFMKLMRYGAEFNEADARLRWIYRLTDGCCFDAVAQRGDNTAATSTGIPHPAVRPEVRDAAMSFLHELQDPERTLAVWRFVDGEDEETIAAELDWSLRAVSRRLRDLRQRIAEALEDDADAPPPGEHPSPMRLEAWSVGEPDPGVDQHVGDCKECRDYVVSLEMAKEVFQDQEEPETFVSRMRRRADTEPMLSLVQAEPEPEAPEVPAPAPEPSQASADAASDGANPAGVIPAEEGGASWISRKRWWLAGPALAVVAVVVAVVAVRMHDPEQDPGASARKQRTGASANTALAPEEVLRLKGPIKVAAVVVGKDGKQSRVSGMVYTTTGIKVRVELKVPGAMPVTVGVLDDSGEWISLVEGKQFTAGVHQLDNDLAFDDRHTTARVIAGTPKQIAKALEGNSFRGLPELLIQPVGKTPAKKK